MANFPGNTGVYDELAFRGAVEAIVGLSLKGGPATMDSGAERPRSFRMPSPVTDPRCPASPDYFLERDKALVHHHAIDVRGRYVSFGRPRYFGLVTTWFLEDAEGTEGGFNIEEYLEGHPDLPAQDDRTKEAEKQSGEVSDA